MSDIVLIYPKTGNDMTAALAPPHSLLAIAAAPDAAGYKVKIIDQRVDLDWKQHLLIELNTRPQMVGITTMTGSQINYAIHAARVVRRRDSNIPIVWGGRHPSLMPFQTIASGLADGICVGEGDFGLLERLKNHNLAGVRTDGQYCQMDDLLPTPWHLIDVEKYIHSDMYLPNSPRTLDIGQTSRGCPFRCKFCSQGREPWRAMSVDRAVNHIQDAVKRFRLTGIWIRDDEFYVNTNRAVQICEKLIPMGIKWYTSGTRIDIFNRTPYDALDVYRRGGASVLKFGAESGSNRVLEYIGKNITVDDIKMANFRAETAGITPAYNFMAGFPTETFDEIDQTIDLMTWLKANNPAAQLETLSTFCAMPGTEMWGEAIKHGMTPPQKLDDWVNWRFDEYDQSGTRNPWLSPRDRQTLGNLVYLSIMANVAPNLLKSYSGFKGAAIRAAYTLPQKYFYWRFKTKSYRFMPELRAIKYLRDRFIK